jgi:tetratricopeptide (TPR) repeat protein
MLERAFEVGQRAGLDAELLGRFRLTLSQTLGRDETEAAIGLCRQALELIPDTPQEADFRCVVAVELAQRLINVGQQKEAESLLLETRETLQASTTAPPETSATCTGSLGLLALSRQDLGAAERLFGEAIAVLEPHATTPQLVSMLSNRGVVRKRLGDLDGARADYDRALALQLELLPVPRKLGPIEYNLARLHVARGDRDRALDFQRRAVSSFERSHGADHRDTLQVEFRFVEDLMTLELWAEASALARAMLPRQRAAMGAQHGSVAVTLDRLADCVAAMGGDAGEVEALRAEAQGIREASR